MADVRTFRAATMREALDLVRDKLGADAVILHTRQVMRHRFLPWRKAVQEVEITASLHFQSAPPAERKPAEKKPAARKQAERKPAARSSAPPSAESQPRSTRQTPGGLTGNRLDLISEPTESDADMLNRAPAPPSFRRRPQSASSPDSERLPQRAFFEPLPADVPENRFTARNLTARWSKSDDADPTAALARRLDTIQQMLHDLGRANFAPRPEEIPNELFQLYTELIDAEVEDEVARDLIVKLKRSAGHRPLPAGADAKTLLTALVESEIRCCEPIASKPGRRKVVALVGATGVGKTTTIAKLAANFRLRSKIKMGLVTVDTYRVAAVDQLRTYAEIIDLPMKVVTNAVEMRQALDELAGLDLVLIDTAGRTPKDDAQIQEVKSLLAAASVDEVHLVMSLTSSLRGLETAAAKFTAAGTTALILTKLDEASGMGALLSVARRIHLPISYLTAGQAVPDDIESAHPRRIARLILGQERAGK